MFVTESPSVGDREMRAAPKAIQDNTWAELPSDTRKRK